MHVSGQVLSQASSDGTLTAGDDATIDGVTNISGLLHASAGHGMTIGGQLSVAPAGNGTEARRYRSKQM